VTSKPVLANKHVLWIGDAVAQTGFARATHNTVGELKKRGWDVSVLGVNYFGDPHDYPYKIYPARNGGDLFGYGRVADLVVNLEPDVVVIQNDPWNVPDYVEEIRRVRNVPIVASMPVDGDNCRARALNELTHAIFWTTHAKIEAEKGGYSGPATVIPLGVDLDVYKPMDRGEARRAWNLPEKVQNAFIVGNVNRNQPRKRLDLTIAWFCDWIRQHKIDDAYLLLHIAPTGERGYDCKQLMTYFGGTGKLIYAQVAHAIGIDERDMRSTYACMDVQVTTTQGEGFGLTTLEGMACGIPQIVPQWAALGEWATAAIQVPCVEISATWGEASNAIGGIAGRVQFQHALTRLYRRRDERERISTEGLALVQEPRYRWQNIGKEFDRVLREVIEPAAVNTDGPIATHSASR
jgi:D-inositol-3-phosphate glycosyltransferase